MGESHQDVWLCWRRKCQCEAGVLLFRVHLHTAIPGKLYRVRSFVSLQPLDYKPVPVEKREESSYLLELKQEYRSAMKDSPFYIKTLERKKDIERYSDKYQMNGQDGNSAWEPGKALLLCGHSCPVIL